MNDETLAFLLQRSGNPDALTPPIYAEPSEHAAAREEPVMLEVVLLGGERLALPYRTLYAVALHPSTGVVATFATHTVTISGVYLRSTYDSIVKQDANRLEAVGTRPQHLVEGVAVIFSIKTEQRT